MRLKRTHIGIPRRSVPARTTAAWVPAALALVLLAAVLGPPVLAELSEKYDRWAWTRSRDTPWLLMEPIGARITDPADIILMIDDSGSTVSSDPGGARWIQTAELRRFMSVYMSEDRLSVGRFATTASPLAALAPAEHVDVGAARQLPIDGGSTELGPAIDEANKLLADEHSRGRQRVLVLLTDGKNSDGEVSEIVDRLVGRTDVVVLGLDDDRAWSHERGRWIDSIDDDISIDGSAHSIAMAQAHVLEAITGQTIPIRQMTYDERSNPR